MYLLEMCEARDAGELAMYRDTFLWLLLVVRSCETVGRQSRRLSVCHRGPTRSQATPRLERHATSCHPTRWHNVELEHDTHRVTHHLLTM